MARNDGLRTFRTNNDRRQWNTIHLRSADCETGRLCERQRLQFRKLPSGDMQFLNWRRFRSPRRKYDRPLAYRTIGGCQRRQSRFVALIFMKAPFQVRVFHDDRQGGSVWCIHTPRVAGRVVSHFRNFTGIPINRFQSTCQSFVNGRKYG